MLIAVRSGETGFEFFAFDSGFEKFAAALRRCALLFGTMSSFSDECSESESDSALSDEDSLDKSGESDLRAAGDCERVTLPARLRVAISGVCAWGNASDSSDDELLCVGEARRRGVVGKFEGLETFDFRWVEMGDWTAVVELLMLLILLIGFVFLKKECKLSWVLLRGVFLMGVRSDNVAVVDDGKDEKGEETGEVTEEEEEDNEEEEEKEEVGVRVGVGGGSIFLGVFRGELPVKLYSLPSTIDSKI